MEKPAILHLITPAKNASPFDVNMAIDAGFTHLMTYTNVSLNEVQGLTQDAIFSRSPSGVKREALFFGGRDINLSMDMLSTAKNTMFNPFQCSVMADPSGAFTTAAAMIAKVELFAKSLVGKKIAIFGCTGPVGGVAAIIAAKCGAEVTMVSHHSMLETTKIAEGYVEKYGVQLKVVDGSTKLLKAEILHASNIALCCAAAGVQVLSLSQIQAAQLQIIADVNAVQPTGAEGVDVMADGVIIEDTQTLGIGALAIGQLKYATQHNLLKRLLSEQNQVFDFMSAYAEARLLSQA